jgi:ketosteroid isomerase-like protein
MTENKKTVQAYIDGFNKTDHAKILSCLTEDVVWDIPGAFHAVGKAEFDQQIEGDDFVGHPTITLTRLVEENDVVVAEGSVTSARKDGGRLNALFCDVFELRDAKIKRLVSYLTILS